MRRQQQQQQDGVQASITRFAKKQAPTAAHKDKKPKLDSSSSTLLQVLGAGPVSSSKANSKQHRAQSAQQGQTAALLHSAVSTAAPVQAATRSALRQRQPGPEVGSGRPTGPQQQQPPRAQQQANAALQPCPLCGQQLPAEQLQQHVDAELAELENLDESHNPGQQPQPQQQQQWTACSEAQQAGSGSSTWWPKVPRQQPPLQHHVQLQQQQQWPPPAQFCAAMPEQPQAKRQKARQQPQQPWWQQQQQQQPQQQQQQQQQQHPNPQHRQGSARQQHRRSASQGPSSGTGSGSGRAPGRVQVKSLSAAPRRPVGPDGQPVTQVDGGFDHWGDSSINYLDDSAIGIDGSLPSADAYWEGIGRCAMGPRTLR